MQTGNAAAHTVTIAVEPASAGILIDKEHEVVAPGQRITLMAAMSLGGARFPRVIVTYAGAREGERKTWQSDLP